jgi:hypothetical protein
LNFTLQIYWEVSKGQREPITHEDQLKPLCKYWPLLLDRENPDVVQRLGYLGSGFTFDRVQLPLFLKSTHEKIADALKPEDEDEDEEEEEEESMEVVDD